MGLPWRYAIGCMDDLGLILRAEIVWSKPSGLPESVTDRVRRSHEQWFHFTLEPHYFTAIDEIRVPHEGQHPVHWSDDDNYKWNRDPGGKTRQWEPRGKRVYNPLGKLPGSVWSIPSEPLQVPDSLGVEHFAAFPQEWPRRLILGWCPQEVCSECGEGRVPVTEKEATGRGKSPEERRAANPEAYAESNRGDLAGSQTIPSFASYNHTITGYACACPDNTAPSTPGVVLDPFAGTGTVPMVARALGRTGIGIDLSADYLRLADWRIHESGHAAKTMQRTNAERQGTLL